MIPSFFWDITQQSRLLFTDISGQPVSPIFKGHAVQSWTTGPLKMGPIGCPEVSVTNCQSAVCNVRRTWIRVTPWRKHEITQFYT